MKKKLMMAAVLIGALSLSACVDNKESDSVVAVRTAKAAQLNSIAAMNNAEAEVKKAIAAYHKAQAEIMQMDADTQKAGLEAALAEAKVKAEAALERAKADLEEAKAELIKNLDKVDQATKDRVKQLLTEANNLLNNSINPDRLNLITAKNNLALFRAKVITADIVNKLSIITQERTKATAQALITEYDKYSKEDRANAEKAANEADAKKVALDKIEDEKNTAKLNAYQAYREANVKISGSVYFQTILNLPNKYEYVDGASVYYTNDDATSGSVWKEGYEKYTPDMDLINKKITQWTREISVAKTSLSEAEKTLADVKATDAYKALQQAVVDAQAKFDKEKTDIAKNELITAENNLMSATSTQEQNIVNAKNVLKYNEDGLKAYNDRVTFVTGDNATAYNTLVDALVITIDKKVEADIAYDKADHNWFVQDALAGTLRSIASGLTDYETAILSQKKTISEADERITLLNTATEEQTVLNQEKYIAQLENNLSVNEPIYQSYLNQIKALVEGSTAE